MIRGTTPTIQITVNGIDLSDTHSVHVTIAQTGTKTKDFSGENIEIEGQVISVWLTQEQSLSLRTGMLELQVNGLDALGRRWASAIQTVNVNTQLYGEVIS